jgi:hypothetical protein
VPAGARLSLDSWRRRLRVAREGGDPTQAPLEAPWALLPLRLTQVTAALGYFFSGASKLANAGVGWANGYTLQGIMLEYDSPWSETFAAHVGLCAAMSVGLLVVQTSFPLIFAHSALRWVYVPLAVVFHLLAMQTMATGTFLTLWFTLAAFVDLERVPGFLRRNVLEAPLARGVAWAATLAVLALGVVRLYTLEMPGWTCLLGWPLVVTLLLGARREKLVLRWNRRDARVRRLVASLGALDWSGRLCLVAVDEGTLAARERLGGERTGREALALAARELPLVVAWMPWRLRGPAFPARVAARTGAGGERP